MTATSLPGAAAKAAALLIRTHACVTCRNLPERPFDEADREPGVEYRPKAPRPAPHGGPRSRRCTTHERTHQRAARERLRGHAKQRRYGLPPALQQALWEFQGRSCPCGRKRAAAVPAGVALDHDRVLARRHNHPDDEGCLECVAGFLCMSCNRETIGRLERAYAGDRVAIATALANVVAHLTDPPLRRLLAAHPELLEAA